MAALKFKCKIMKIQGTELTLLSKVAWHSASLSLTVLKDGSPAIERDLKVGMLAVAQIKAGAVERVILGELPGAAMLEEGVLIYSRRVFPVQCLIDAYSHSESAKTTVELIACRCTGVRKCSANGEMGFWQAFAIALIEHFGRKSTPISALRTAIRYIEESEGKDLVANLRSLEQSKAAGRNGMEWVIEMHKEEAFWVRLAEVWKDFASQYLRTLGNDVDFLGVEPGVAQYILSQEPLSEIGIMLMAKAFSLKITIFSPEGAHMKKTYELEESTSELADIYLFQDKAVFHVLYTPLQLEVDEYSIDEMRIVHREKVAWDRERLFRKQKQRVKLKSTIEDDLAVCQNRVVRLTRFTKYAQTYVHRACLELEKRQFDNFYSADLLKSGLQMVQECRSSMLQISQIAHKTDNDFVRHTVGLFSELQERSKFVNDHFLSNKEWCEHCKVEIGMVVLDCMHVFCISDIRNYVVESLRNDPLIFKPNGDTTEDMKCLKLTCFTRISGKKLREIMSDEDFQAWIQYVETLTNTKCCWRCSKIRKTESFQQVCPCGQQICNFCLCDLYRRNQRNCVCGTQFSPEAQQWIKRTKVLCSLCFLQKTILHNFSHVECSDHIICHDCLSNSVRYSQRCRMCYRFFSAQELHDLKSIIDKICIYCGIECSGKRMWTDCGCVICLNCAKIGVVNTEKWDRCFACNEELSENGRSLLLQYLPETRGEFSLSSCLCMICYEFIGEKLGLTLTCGHVFHAECMNDYVEVKVKADFSEEEIPCPTAECKVRIPVKDLEHFLSSETFTRLYENVIRWRSVPCPRCGNLVLERDENDAKKSSVKCRNCGFHFCTACNGEFSQGHSQAHCQFNLIQIRVQMAELSASEGDIVVQCPGCKNPFVYAGGCYNVTCRSKECGIKYCVWCSTPACQYTTHGDSWHRPKCKMFKNMNPLKGMSSDCQVCQSLGKVCRPPQDLRTPQRFAFDEY